MTAHVPTPTEPVAGSTQTMSRESSLVTLLRDLFSEGELRQLAVTLQRGDDLVSSLPGGTSSRAEIASQLAGALKRRNLVDAWCFARIAQERPGQRDRIASVAAAWDVPFARGPLVL